MLELFIPFLQSCIDRIKSDSISIEQRLLLSEFYTKCEYTDSASSEHRDTDLLKYLSMGWYIYNELDKIPHVQLQDVQLQEEIGNR